MSLSIWSLASHVLVVQWRSGIRDHVFIRIFRIHISQLPVCDARVFVVQWKSGMKHNVFMCVFCIRLFQLPLAMPVCCCSIKVRDNRSCFDAHVSNQYISTACLRCPCLCCSIKVRDKRSCVYAMFCVRVYQLPVCDARVLVDQTKSWIMNDVFMCMCVASART